MKRAQALIALLLFCAWFNLAWFDSGYCGNDSPSENRSEKEAEFEWIRAEGEALTTIATKTKLDADEAPGGIVPQKSKGGKPDAR